jgi:streptomycin 6-kinase
VLEPLARGEAAAFVPNDWGGPPKERVVVEPGGVVVLEGVTASREAFRPYLALSIWVETPRELCLQRGLERDGEAMRAQWEAWLAAEDRYIAAERPQEHADAVVLGTGMPALDAMLRTRLRRRFGGAIDEWLDRVPAVLHDLGERWGIAWGPLVQRGSMSIVVRCLAGLTPAVLKLSPARERVAQEAAALAAWTTTHVPRVLDVDQDAGALLIEAIAPGTPLADAAEEPPLEELAALLVALHEHAAPQGEHPSAAARVAYLFDAGLKNYERRPDLLAVVPRATYERGRAHAARLAAAATATVLLHGDLTPANVLLSSDRGLVAVDPAPCVGDAAFDAVDLVYFGGTDADAIAAKAHALAAAAALDGERLLEWCVAFAPLVALEVAEGDGPAAQVEALLTLAGR